jgi:hypothetical protein
LFIGNSTINTFVTSAGLNVNATTIANSSQVYSPLHTTGGLVTGTGGFLANSTTVYIGNNTVYSYSNSSHYLTSGTGTGTGGFLANNTTVYIGNNTVYSLANSSYFLTSGTGTGTGGFIANTSTVFVGNNTVFTVSNNSSFYTYGTGTGTGGLIANNSTLLIGNNTIYSYSNSSHYLTSGTGTGTGGFIANTTTIFIGNNTSYSLANNSSIYISGTLIANSTGPYGKTEGSLFVNKAFTSGGSYSDTFFTAGGVAENKIGVLYPSQSESFLYSNSTEWGLFSLSGGKIIYFNRGDSTVRTANLHNTRTTSLGVGVAATGIVGQIKATSIYVDNGSFGNSETYGVYIDANQINASVVKNDVAEIAINYSGYLAGTTQFRNLNVFDGKNNSIAFFDGASGNFTAAGNVTAYSDIKLKTNVETISGALEKVLNMRGVMFNRKDTGARGTGVIAQEIQQVLPEVVVEGKDNLSVAYGNIVGVLIEAIKELEKKVKEMEKK